jgi:omega-6 fatty acid desaturase (delta-12 desaturase)
MSTLTENLLVAIYYFCLYSYDPYVLRIEICASLLGVMLSLIFLHGQHKFDGAYRQNKGWDRKTAVLRGTVFIDVPWWLRYFTYNIEYHHVHHLDSSIPGYQLRQIGEPDLENCGVARTTLWDIIRDSYAERSVFDETLQQFVSPKMNTEIDPRTTKRP